MEGPRGLKTNEREQLERLTHDALFSHAPKQKFLEMFPSFLAKDNYPQLLVFKDKGRLVSHVGQSLRDLWIEGARIPVVLIGGVSTDAAYRGRHLAGRLLTKSIRDGRAAGRDLMVISGFRGLYARIGAAKCGQFLRYQFKTSLLNSLQNLRFRVSPALGRDLPALEALYRREPLGYIRPFSDVTRMHQAGWARVSRSRWHAVRTRGSIIGYFVAPKKQSWIIEYAGNRAAVLAAFGRTCRKERLRKAEIRVPAGDIQMTALLDALGARSQAIPFDGSIRVLHFPRLMERLRPVLAAKSGETAVEQLRFEEHGDAFTFRLGKERWVCQDRALLARVLFGDPEGKGVRALPRQGNLGRLLRRILPVPLPEYGINFV